MLYLHTLVGIIALTVIIGGIAQAARHPVTHEP